DEANKGKGKEFSPPSISLDSTIILTDRVKEWIEDDGVRSLYDPGEVTPYFHQVLRQLDMECYEIGENIKDIQERVDWVLGITGLNAYGAAEGRTLGQS
ncbi:11741_t:CDS:1, partial [Acaulospora colombiana]